MPTDALEEWRYSRIAGLDLSRFTPAGSDVGEQGLDPIAAELVGSLGADPIVVRTVNGRLVSGSLSGDVEVLDEVEEPEPGGALEGHDPDPYAMLNRAFAPSWLRIRAVTSQPRILVVIHQVGDAPIGVFPRTLVELGRLTELNVVEILRGGAGAFVAPVTRLAVGDAAHLTYTVVQLLHPTSWQIASQSSTVGRDATLVSAAVALGGGYARLRTESSLVAPGASGRLLALYFGAGSQMPDFRTVQHHGAPKTQSELLYKGVVADTAHSVYSGVIRVDKGAGGTNAMQTNRNLVLHDGAHADSVPNLEIEDNDVRCSHASAVGPIADDQRFYLESRGVPPRVADRLIALGFMDELLEQLPVGGLRAPLRSLLGEKLANVQVVPGD